MSKLQLQDLDAVCVVFKRILFVTQFHLIASLAPTLPFEAAGGRILAAGWQLGEPSNWNNNECLHYHSPCCCYCPCSPPAPCHCFWLCLPLFGGVAAGLILSAFAPGDATAREDMVRVKGRRGSGQSKYISDFGRFYGAKYTEKKVYYYNNEIRIFKVFKRSHQKHCIRQQRAQN